MKSASTLLALSMMGQSTHDMPFLNLNVVNRPVLGSPAYNQRKARKARRQRFGAGDRFAFKRQ